MKKIYIYLGKITFIFNFFEIFLKIKYIQIVNFSFETLLVIISAMCLYNYIDVACKFVEP